MTNYLPKLLYIIFIASLFECDNPRSTNKHVRYSNQMNANNSNSLKQKITPCLWVETTNAKEVIDYYLTIFKEGKLIEHNKHKNPSEAGGGNFETAILDLNGIEFSILAAGPYFKFNESVSFVINCQDQEEVDYYWNALTINGGQESACGWCKDKYGLSWQIVPVEYFELINSPDAKVREKAMSNTFKQKKIILSELK